MTTVSQAGLFPQDPLAIRQLAEFDAVLGEISEKDKRNKRILYLQSAAVELQGKINSLQLIKYGMLPVLLLPLLGIGGALIQSLVRLQLLQIALLILVVFVFLLFSWGGHVLLSGVIQKGARRMVARLYAALEYWELEQSDIANSGFQFDEFEKQPETTPRDPRNEYSPLQ